MNKRMKNKIEKRRRQQICKVLDLCLQINGLHGSERAVTGNHPTVFFYFLGHVASVKVDVHECGWDYGTKPDREYRKYIDQPGELEELIDQLKKLAPEVGASRG